MQHVSDVLQDVNGILQCVSAVLQHVSGILQRVGSVLQRVTAFYQSVDGILQRVDELKQNDGTIHHFHVCGLPYEGHKKNPVASYRGLNDTILPRLLYNFHRDGNCTRLAEFKFY